MILVDPTQNPQSDTCAAAATNTTSMGSSQNALAVSGMAGADNSRKRGSSAMDPEEAERQKKTAKAKYARGYRAQKKKENEENKNHVDMCAEQRRENYELKQKVSDLERKLENMSQQVTLNMSQQVTLNELKQMVSDLTRKVENMSQQITTISLYLISISTTTKKNSAREDTERTGVPY